MKVGIGLANNCSFYHDCRFELGVLNPRGGVTFVSNMYFCARYTWR